MRRFALPLLAGWLWLFAAALPAIADGGPHGLLQGGGTAGFGSDQCAACHRTTLAVSRDPFRGIDLCIACHGGLGATTDVLSGIQYAIGAATEGRDGPVLGALRGGGFVRARLATADGVRYRFGEGEQDFRGTVPVLTAGRPVTSSHLSIRVPVLATAWGSGPVGSGAGRTTILRCTSCHDPHGTGGYRILAEIPGALTQAGGSFVPAATGVRIADPAPAGATRDYTVIAPPGTDAVLWAADLIGRSAAEGDYWGGAEAGSMSSVAWQRDGVTPATYPAAISAWCAGCHTRIYDSGGGMGLDPTFAHRTAIHDGPCTQCHVAHGSNASMTGWSAANEDPGGAALEPGAPGYGDSRLLKVDDRGTCQLCHDPTGTSTVGGVMPLPEPTAVP